MSTGILKIWTGSAYEEMLLNTETHKSTHATGGGDALSPADIGAATAAQGTDDRTASGLRTASTVVSVSAATAPSPGQVLTATGTTAATWQTPAGGDAPGGSATELQYRGGASTLGGADGTAWDATNKRLSLGAGASPAAVLHVKSDSASEVALTIDGTTSQTASLQEWRNNSGTVLSSITAAGIHYLPDGSAAAPALSFSGATNLGLYRASNNLYLVSGGVAALTVHSAAIYISTVLYGTSAANTIQAFRWLVSARTSNGNESGDYSLGIMTNAGATALIERTLPTAAAGLTFTFSVMDADGFKIIAASGDNIRVIDKITGTAGYIQSTTIGSTVTLSAMDATTWLATSIHGVWTDGTFTYDDTTNTTP